MMDEVNPRYPEIEEVQGAPDHGVTYNDMLNNIRQAVHEFRETHADASDSVRPIIVSYESADQTVTLLSNRVSTITIQISSKTNRLSYVYDPAAEYAVTLNSFDEDSETSTESFGLLPTEANTPQLLSVHAYIQDSLHLSD